jgi:hypothetical protein
MPTRDAPARGPWRAALFAALALTGANAAKPLVIDDAFYVALARQVREHPGDPYGFEIYWYDAPEPAMQIGTLAPVVPYWLAGATALFGERSAAWKLSLLPFALALTGSLAFLLSRFAQPLATPLVLALALSPAVLPGFNLMLDVPAVALGLAAFALFVRACERKSAIGALAAGLGLGLALETKYSAVLYPALFAVHAALVRRPREGAIALLAAGALFVGWESWLLARYGQSHFLAGIERVQTFPFLAHLEIAEAERPGATAVYWTLGLLSLLGGTAPQAGLLALAGLGARPLLVGAAAGLAAAGFAVIPALPRPAGAPATGFLVGLLETHPELWVFVPLGVLTFACAVAVALRLLRGTAAATRRDELLLAAWLLLEIAGYFVVSPFPAVRRVIGVSIAATLLAARGASRRWGEPGTRLGARIAMLFAFALGLLYAGSELADAFTRRAFVARIEERLSQLGASPARETVWYTGHWEVQYYGEQAGWRAVIPERSRLRRGDWLVVPTSVDQPRIAYPPSFQQVSALTATSPSPWSTIPAYYSGLVPLERQRATQGLARIYRVTQDVTPGLGSPGGG